MLKEASGCYEKASRCVHLPDPETTNRTLLNQINSILYYTIRIKLGKIKSPLIRINVMNEKMDQNLKNQIFKLIGKI